MSAGAGVSSSSTVVSLAAPTSSPTVPSLPATNFPHPAFLAAVVKAVKVALAADKTCALSDVATVLFSMPEPSSSSLWCVSGGVISQHMDLGARTATFLTSSVGFPLFQPASCPPAS